MESLLPDLSPRDSHSLWYTSSRNPLASHDTHLQSSDNVHQQNPANQRRNTQNIERSILGRLRADELLVDRRLHHVSHFGSTWLKPPGIPKTLHQIREERREQEEHQEAMRREQIAQELAEAGAMGPGDAEGQPSTLDDDIMDDVQLDGAGDEERDLDADVPEADDDFALNSDGDDSDEDNSESSDEDEEEEQAEIERAARSQRELMAQMMRRTHETHLQTMGLGDEDEIDEDDQYQMIEEEDVSGVDGDDMGMEVDLDDDIPEAESAGGYEHTDTEAEMSSSDNDQAEMSFVAARAPQRFRASLDASRTSIAISDLLSRDGSSMLGSSPQIQQRRG